MAAIKIPCAGRSSVWGPESGSPFFSSLTYCHASTFAARLQFLPNAHQSSSLWVLTGADCSTALIVGLVLIQCHVPWISDVSMVIINRSGSFGAQGRYCGLSYEPISGLHPTVLENVCYSGKQRHYGQTPHILPQRGFYKLMFST